MTNRLLEMQHQIHTRSAVCGKEAVREFVSKKIPSFLEADRFALCEEHKEALYDSLAEMEMEKEEEVNHGRETRPTPSRHL